MNFSVFSYCCRSTGAATALAATMIGALLLSACVTPGSVKPSASLQPTERFGTALSIPAQGGQWPSLDWPAQIGGSALQQLVDEALADNPGLQVASTRFAAASALAEQTAAAAGPSVGAGFTSIYQRYTENGIVPRALAGKRQSDNQLLLNFSYDFDFWGRHAAELRAVLAQGKVVEAEQYNAKLMLATAVARSYVQLSRDFAQLALVERQRDLRMAANELTTRRIAAGLDPQGDLQSGVQQLENLRAEQSQWQQAISLGRHQLAALLGKGPDRGLTITRPPIAPAMAPTLPDNLPLELLGRRPDIVAARWRVEASQGAIDTAQAAFYPNINLTAFAGLSSLGLSNLLKAGSLAAGFGPAIRLPIFEGGALQANLKGRVAEYSGAVDAYNQALTEALHDVADQVEAMRSATQQSAHQQQASKAAGNSVALSSKRQVAGTINRLQVIAAQAVLVQQQRIAIDAELRVTEARLGLIKALGGGFEVGATDLVLPVSSSNSGTSPSRSSSTKAAL